MLMNLITWHYLYIGDPGSHMRKGVTYLHMYVFISRYNFSQYFVTKFSITVNHQDISISLVLLLFIWFFRFWWMRWLLVKLCLLRWRGPSDASTPTAALRKIYLGQINISADFMGSYHIQSKHSNPSISGFVNHIIYLSI